jgi:hypothetical protein
MTHDFQDRLGELGLTTMSLKLRHGVTIVPRTRLTQSVVVKKKVVGHVAPVAGGFHGFVHNDREGATRHPAGPFSSIQMAAGAIAVEKGAVVLPQLPFQMSSPGPYDGDELANTWPTGQV